MKICVKYRFLRKQEKRPSHRKERFSDFFTLALWQAQRSLLCLNRRDAEGCTLRAPTAAARSCPCKHGRDSRLTHLSSPRNFISRTLSSSFLGRSPPWWPCALNNKLLSAVRPLRGSGYILWVARFTPFPPNLIKRRLSAAPRGHYP
ncbi:hypothetical protein SAMN05720762_105237 [Fibrobacter sp. UWH4]|nr:hypothetical protein SAMN05720762_105237 [Fibrobacter sp. UWH4]